jgi:uncharacterized protein (TIGR00645 family)
MARLIESVLERGIFASRWIQAPLYVGLIVAQLAYAVTYGVELWHVLLHTLDWTPKLFLLGLLELIDFLMVANLITMVVIGGYAIFVSKLNIEGHPDRPDWLEHIDPGAIKVKLGASLIGISSIQLLQSFVKLGEPGMAKTLAAQGVTLSDYYQQVQWQIVLHVVFLVSTLLLACVDFVMYRRHRAGDGAHDHGL